MSKMPVDVIEFDRYIQGNELFEIGEKYLVQCLKKWYEEAPDEFIENMRVSLDKVMKEYKFSWRIVSVTKNFYFDPPKDYLSISIRIGDEEDSYIAGYTVFLDFSFNFLGEKLVD
jgi:hypothetical protein